MADYNPRTKVPARAGKGEVFEIKTMISHPMETGRRKDPAGKTIPRRIINRFECVYNGETVFAVDMHPSVSANPYLAFHARAVESGTIELRWIEDGGKVISVKEQITVG